MSKEPGPTEKPEECLGPPAEREVPEADSAASGSKLDPAKSLNATVELASSEPSEDPSLLLDPPHSAAVLSGDTRTMPESSSECEIGTADTKAAELECDVTLATGRATSPKSSSVPQDTVILQGSEMPLDHARKPTTASTGRLQQVEKTQSSAASTAQRASQSNKSTDHLAENSTAKASSSEHVCVFLWRLINIPLTAAENIAKDKNLIVLLIVLVAGAVLWYWLTWVDAWAASSVAPLRFAWTGISTSTSFLVAHITNLGHTIAVGFARISNFTSTLGSSEGNRGLRSTLSGLGDLVTNSSTYTGFLCPSGIGVCLAAWLSLCCRSASSPNSTSASDPGTSLAVFNHTSTELGHWAGVSVSLGPYINDFQIASVPLVRERVFLEYYKDVEFEGKKELLPAMGQYGDELYNSSQCLLNITLHTNRILKVMVANFRVVSKTAAKAFEADQGRWRTLSKTRKSHINDRILHLLDVLDRELLHLIAKIDSCKVILAVTVDLSLQVDGGLRTAYRDVKQQIQKGSGLFRKPNEDLYEVNRIISESTSYAASEAQDKLELASRKLAIHREEVRDAKETIDLSLVLAGKDGLAELVSVLHTVFGDLYNESEKVEVALRTRREDAEQKVMEFSRKRYAHLERDNVLRELGTRSRL
ncbi:hypothetical protein PV08_00603 [Exophiala spinifera]|uniref:Uncharacterized protein n=1 Tax=Exophiala spinifera TaxID=91928 RepID=A0A0D2BM95_9EURO|nr:uncharacterized protein PV08_00603 [Exophiala spinifera]KIW20028.1 hypothetical protein PV08_00603 [Exophiala spinifera]